MFKSLQIKLAQALFIALAGATVFTGCNKDNGIRPAIGSIGVAPIIPVTATSSKFISKVFDYQPAPAQFINEANVGSPEAAQAIVGGISKLVSLGSFGGFIVFGFDHSIVNKAGADVAIYGNPLPGWSEPGTVMVSQDNNGNGQPDDEWYELAGSEYNAPTTIKNYRITYYNPKGTLDVPWKDNQGKSGVVPINRWHTHNYYPLFAANQDSVSFTGTRVRSTFASGTSAALSWGYADNLSTGDDYAKNGFNSFDIDWAVDKNGKQVVLNTIDFVKVYTAQNDPGNASFGEISTEVRGAEDLSMSR